MMRLEETPEKEREDTPVMWRCSDKTCRMLYANRENHDMLHTIREKYGKEKQ